MWPLTKRKQFIVNLYDLKTILCDISIVSNLFLAQSDSRIFGKMKRLFHEDSLSVFLTFMIPINGSKCVVCQKSASWYHFWTMSNYYISAFKSRSHKKQWLQLRLKQLGKKLLIFCSPISMPSFSFLPS